MRQLRTDNHYVPQVYLRQWATDGKIPTYGLLVPHDNVPLWKRHSLKGIAFHQNLYTQVIGGTENDDLEQWLDAEFESPAAPAITRAVTQQRLTRDDWEALVRFAFAQDVRTPARLRAFLSRQGREMQSLLDKTLSSAVVKLAQEGRSVRPGETKSASGFPLKITVQENEDGSGSLKAETVVGRKLWHWSLRHHLESTIAKIPYRGWAVLRSAEGCHWPTSDNPLIRLNYFKDGSYNFEGGWAVPNGDVMLPLSPTHLLHLCAGRRTFGTQSRLDAATSQVIRRIIIEHADRYVFAKEEFDVHAVRKRTVSRELHAAERETWARWHKEQCDVELDH